MIRTPLRKLLFTSVVSGVPAVEDTATGNPLVFTTDLAKPLKSLVANFLPVQASGTPSPENVLPITGWDAVKVAHTEGNLYTGEGNTSGYLNRQGEIQSSSSYLVTDYMPVVGGEYYISGYSQLDAMSSSMYLAWYDSEKTLISTVAHESNNAFFRVQAPNNAVYCRDSVRSGKKAYYIFASGTVYPVTWQGTIYGGYVDLVTGEVWATYGADVYDGSNDEQWDKLSSGSASAFGMTISKTGFNKNGPKLVCDYLKPIARNATWGNFDNWISYNNTNFVTGIQSITTVADWRAYLAEHNLMVAYELAEPVFLTTLTPQQITALKGDNTIWSDADGEMTAVYLKKG